MNGERQASRRGFTLVELLLVVAIIGIVAALLLPALSRAREQARTAKCAQQLRQMHVGYTLLKEESQNWSSIAAKPNGRPALWMMHLNGNTGVFTCPSEKQTTNIPVAGVRFSFIRLRDEVTTNVIDKRSLTEPGRSTTIVYTATSMVVSNWDTGSTLPTMSTKFTFSI